jgi:hypothetical protein
MVVLACAVSGCGPGARNGGNADGHPSDGSNNSTQPPATCAEAAQDKSAIGCEYYAVDPDNILPGSCFAAFVANISSAPIAITVDRAGMTFDVSTIADIPSGTGQSITYTPLPNGMLPAGQVAILFLDSAVADGEPGACPTSITAAVTGTDTAVHGTALGDAFHITTSAPAVVYDIFPYGGGSTAITSATLLLPTSVWDVNYVAVDAYAMSAGQPDVEIVAQTDATTVTITPVAAIVQGTGVAGATAGTPTQYTLSKGQELQFTQDDELAGSVISASSPIGVWGGASCMDIDVTAEACDGAHQQIPPVKALGNHYAAVRYRNRFPATEETVPWRMVGAVDGTTLTYLPSTPTGAPTTLARGQVVEFESPGQFVVQSQGSNNPFYMGAHMTGCTTVNPAVLSGDGGDCRGDPEFVNIVPPEQYLASYTFFTDPTYPETDLVLTRERVSGSFADVTLDCVGTVTGWTAIDAADDMEYTRVDLVTGNFEPVGSCNNGVHVASSAQPFGLVVWAWGSEATGGAYGDPSVAGFYTQAVSYAYPAGASAKAINTVVIQ